MRGWIYDPEDEDDTFNAEIKLTNGNTLQVTGYLGIKLLGETYIWKRAPEPFERLQPAPAGLLSTHACLDFAWPTIIPPTIDPGAFHAARLSALASRQLRPSSRTAAALRHDVALLIERDHVIAVVEHQVSTSPPRCACRYWAFFRLAMSSSRGCTMSAGWRTLPRSRFTTATSD